MIEHNQKNDPAARVAKRESDVPIPRAVRRVENSSIRESALSEGFTALQARIIAGRVSVDAVTRAGSIKGLIQPSLRALTPPDALPDIEIAVDRIVLALTNDEIIATCGDFDADGTTAHAVLWSALTNVFGHPLNHTSTWCASRLLEGYGLSDAFVDRLLAHPDRPAVLIAADKGSSDEPRIRRLAEAGIDVIIADHHELKDGTPPPSALAVVNPIRTDHHFPDAAICGAHVAFLLMASVRHRLMAIGKLPSGTPSLEHLLDLVGVGTVADCVSLADSHNNRAVVRASLARINADVPRPCWPALLGDRMGGGPISAEDIAFKIAPAINARGRLDDALAGLHCLSAKDESVASKYAALLHADNETRKRIQREAMPNVMQQASGRRSQGRSAVVVHLIDVHPGIVGILAARIVEAFGCPAIVFATIPNRKEILTGSARTVPGFHIRDALSMVDVQQPGLIQSYGGHAGAAGLKISHDRFDEFEESFEAVGRKMLNGMLIGPHIQHDGSLIDHFHPMVMSELMALDPYGRGFEFPLFLDVFRLDRIREIGKQGGHYQCDLCHVQSGTRWRAVWFSVPEAAVKDLRTGHSYSVAYTPKVNARDRSVIEFIVRYIWLNGIMTTQPITSGGNR